MNQLYAQNETGKIQVKAPDFPVCLYVPKHIVVPDTAFHTEFIRNDNTEYEVQANDDGQSLRM
ncbi:hypothetical protein B4V02_10845 [Paenibacillus kribbensis]|uniref:Uncharacterized protein n=1 Tax=Paenibacillus kribbensis TaxID=172713 RepID=A0A222WME3_9BACL|nr:hypothetical protein B4V02_10845 [Paenibacillus kribbensis]